MDDELTNNSDDTLLDSIDTNVSNILELLEAEETLDYSDTLTAINDNLLVLVEKQDAVTVAETASTVTIDATQYDDMMTLQTAQLTVMFFVLAFVILIFGVQLAHILTKDWRV